MRPGDAALDVGCGAGEICVELAALVGASGRVAGIDPSDAMLGVARTAADASQLPIDLHVGSVYELPFPDGAFDAVRAERVFQHLEDPEAALREMLRVTRAGLTEIELHTTVHDFAYPDFVRLFFISERLESAVGAGDITPDAAADFVAMLEDRYRRGTFFANIVAYCIVGTKA